MKSIKAKLIMLGAVSIICTIILGVTGIYIMKNSTSNSKVLDDINSIYLRQNENTAAEVSFLYDLDMSHYNEIDNNLGVMKDAAEDANSYSMLKSYKDDLTNISSDIEKAISNTSKLSEMLEYRGFKAGDGTYDSFLNEDAEITDYIAWMAKSDC